MALLDDSAVVILLAASAFFVALAFGLLLRYRQVSQRISSSSDLGLDLWQALEQRMKKQDERILDVMGRLEVVQARVVAAAAAQIAPIASPAPPSAPPAASGGVAPRDVTEPQPVAQQRESRAISQEARVPAGGVSLDETQLAAIRLLGESPRNTRQLTDALGKSREHTARVMKGLFDLGLVQRNDATKPFVYQLTDVGRGFLSPPN
jgi:hypothetical protein